MRSTGLIAISILTLAAMLAAQTFKLDSNLVLVGVSVTDRYHHPVMGLQQDRFEILDDRVPQPVAFFGREDAPLSVGMILDVSGSIGRAVGKIRDALAQFCRVANPKDEFFLVTVSTTPDLLQPFTNDCGDLQGKLFAIPARGNTSLLDGVALAVRQMKKARHPRRALVVVTDGEDNNSRYTHSEIRNMALESDAQIYVLGLPSDVPTLLGEAGPDGIRFFEDLADVTGGRFFPIYRNAEIPAAAKKVGEELHNQYVLGYRPSGVALDGKFHRVLVKLLPQPGAPKLFVTHKSGYYAPLE